MSPLLVNLASAFFLICIQKISPIYRTASHLGAAAQKQYTHPPSPSPLTGFRNVSNKRYSYFHQTIDQYGPGESKNIVKTDVATVFRLTTWPWMSIRRFSLIFLLIEVPFLTFCRLFVVQVVELIKIMLGKLKFDTGISLTGILHSLGPIMSIKSAKISVFF